MTDTVRSPHHSNDAGCSKAPFLRQTVDPDSAAHSTPLRSPHLPGSAAAELALVDFTAEALFRIHLYCNGLILTRLGEDIDIATLMAKPDGGEMEGAD
nr:hypothetical protein [Pectobacterium brasiliense]